MGRKRRAHAAPRSFPASWALPSLLCLAACALGLPLLPSVRRVSSALGLAVLNLRAYAMRSPHSEIAYAEAALGHGALSEAVASAEAVLSRQADCAAVRAASECASLSASANAVLAEAHLLAGELPRALDAVQTAIETLELGGEGWGRDGMGEGMAPSESMLLQRHARLYVTKGRVLEALPPHKCAEGTCTEHAANAYRNALQAWRGERGGEAPGLEEASAGLARVSATLNGASPAYVEALFDEYAGNDLQ